MTSLRFTIAVGFNRTTSEELRRCPEVKEAYARRGPSSGSGVCNSVAWPLQRWLQIHCSGFFGRIDTIGALSPLLASRQVRILEDAAVVWQVRFALRLMTGAKSAVRDRDNRAEELRLLPRI